MTKERRRINELKKELENVRLELRKMEIDRDAYRNEFVKRFKWFISLMGESKTPSLSWLVEDMSKFLNKVQKFYW